MAKTSTETQREPAPKWASLIGTFFHIGYLKPGPGTWASAATMLLWRGLAPFASSGDQTIAAIAASVGVTLIGVPAATRVARALGKVDPSEVVIDEVAGQMIAMIGAAVDWRSLVAALILFRAFDITKPFPLRRLEHLPEGWGIMLDDVGAGLYALALMQVARHFGWL
ncbi:MAG: phosphatidylglycerophosphatase A family protein [Terriglobales bacterium]